MKNHEKKHKISTAATLLNRASNLPSTTDGKAKEIKHVRDALKANGYPPPIISNVLKKKNSTETIPSPEELVGMFFKWAEPSNTHPDFACIPYISGLTEPLSRLLRSNGIRVVRTKPYNRNLLHQNSGHLSIFKPTLFIRSLATIARGTTSVKRDVFQLEKKNISGMSRAALKDLTFQIMLGRTITQLTLRMQLSLTKVTIVCEKLLNHGILQ